MIHVYHADVRDCVDAIVALNADALICDPPYADRVHDKAVSVGKGEPVKRDLGFASLDDRLRAAIVAIADSVKRWSAIFSDIETAHLWHDALGGLYVRTVPWIRWSQPQLSGDRPPSGCELISLAHPTTRKHWSGPGSLTGFDTRSLRGREKYSCEKPLDLMLSLVSWFSDAGDSVVDPCCGAGTTGLACRILERDAVLFDVSADAITRTQTRLASPLSERDRERCERWIAYQEAWLAGEAPTTEAGAARYARAQADTDRVRKVLQ